ncbi:hypothetical protein SAMN04487970_106810 [Paenibacillus tianmuensis]|uniref:Uncharacterized protein n=1 Tax=Paenibacillus tianmuensis TaxID=624147 RepID=A0A1G4TU38_9BACL|nr:hypothetical protein [Paenibacillus tianmuensis]SCW84932.1 hypothetical protein SAMN04487970_106810 [Paenibacillus tianmuensis]
MNHEMVNNRISQLPLAMAGVMYAFSVNGRGLSKNAYTVSPFAKIILP